MKYYLAIDLGATSGRHVIAYKKNNDVVLEEVYRFKTGMDESKDGLVWNIPRLFREIKEGIRLAFLKYDKIESLSIDTWGVDYVLMNGDKEIKPFHAYRNERNVKASEEVHKIISFEELYKHNGLQFATFNTIYQLYDDLKQGRLEKATDYLMLPSYFTYKLTGVKTHEYTEESTSGLLNAASKVYQENSLKTFNNRALWLVIYHQKYKKKWVVTQRLYCALVMILVVLLKLSISMMTQLLFPLEHGHYLVSNPKNQFAMKDL